MSIADIEGFGEVISGAGGLVLRGDLVEVKVRKK
jgi:hypothetical protein